jgi:hypothetical protein
MNVARSMLRRSMTISASLPGNGSRATPSTPESGPRSNETSSPAPVSLASRPERS